MKTIHLEQTIDGMLNPNYGDILTVCGREFPSSQVYTLGSTLLYPAFNERPCVECLRWMLANGKTSTVAQSRTLWDTTLPAEQRTYIEEYLRKAEENGDI